MIVETKMSSTHSAIFNISEIQELNVEAMLESIKTHQYAIIRGLFTKQEMGLSLQSIRAGFDCSLDNPAIGDKPESVMRNFQKLIIGAGAQTNYFVPRFLRILYNPVWDEDRYGMRKHFKRLAQLRNHLQSHPSDYAIDRIQDGLWTASRLQQYPEGGGFFASHRDAISKTNTEEVGLNKFIQILLLVTERGKDYEKGGAFISDGGAVIDLESVAGAGDILVYDGRSQHGVSDIDPHKLPDTKGMTGRIVALVTLYSDMSGENSQFAQYRSRAYNS